MYRERVGRPVRTGSVRLSSAELSRRYRRASWEAPVLAKVIHPTRGTLVVPHSSRLAALMNAAEVWGCSWMEIRDAYVWAADPDAVHAPMPHII